jgi:predicted dehydrogenase
MKKHMTRRSFLSRAAALSLPLVVPASALGREGKPPASDRVAIGLIGTGGMGSYHLNELKGYPDVEILAVCDVDEKARTAAQRAVGGGCAAYNDYRALLDRPDIDAVVVATPDHWHTLVSIHGCQAGKDVYCEKPLTLTIEEANALTAAVRRHGRVLQTGSQQRSSPEFRRACEMVQNGWIGRVDLT